MRLIRILLANSHPIVRSNLRLLIERERGLHVVAEAANGLEATVLADYRQPDVILLDINLSHINGIATAREILAKNAKAIVIFVSSHPDEAYIAEALKTGARGYVIEDCAETDLVPAIEAARTGGAFISPCIRTPAMERLARARVGQSTEMAPAVLRRPL